MQHNSFSTIDASSLRVAIVASRFNTSIMDALLAGAQHACDMTGIAQDARVVIRVPGSFELPVAASAILARGNVDAVIALGCLIKGETTHDQYIASAVGNQLVALSAQYRIPVAFGVLTCQTIAQAQARAEGLEEKNKGFEATMSAVEMALTLKTISG